MEVLSAVLVGLLFSAGIYLILRRSLTKLILGIAILTNAVNLLIFTGAGLRRDAAPLVPDGATAPPPGYADPLPQAFILTAIVIGFGVIAFVVALATQVFRAAGTDDTDLMRSSDQ
jgi:multicomponent Na+:H+ antiporter subunit C